MHAALSRANQKLYHGAILARLLVAERDRQDVPLAVLTAAIGEPAREHLKSAYGWLLIALAESAELPAQPPTMVAELVAREGLEEPLRGELVELRNLETGGWLHELLATTGATGAVRGPEAGLAVVAGGLDPEQLLAWHEALGDLIDRMSHGLDEW